MHKNSPVRAAVVGASGYTGAELMRYLVSHPQVQLGTCLANQQAGEEIAHVYPSLLGRVTGQFEKANYGVLGKEHDVVFLCLPLDEYLGYVLCSGTVLTR